MQPIRNSTGSDSSSEESGDFGFTEPNTTSKQFYQDLIAKANCVSLKALFKIYGLQLDEYNKSCNCPFPNHQDKSPSFHYYPDTDTFYCHGCGKGVKPVNFVVNMENLSPSKAASKILELFKSSSSFTGSPIKAINYGERLEILMNFSTVIREFIQAHPSDKEALAYVEKLSSVLDRVNNKHEINNQMLKRSTLALIRKISLYKLCPQF